MSASRTRVTITADHPAVPAARRADELFRKGDAAGCDTACAEAVRLAGRDPRLRADLAANHVARLFDLGDLPTAFRRCEEYLNGPAAPGHVPLRVLRAELLDAAGHSREAAREVLDLHDGGVDREGPPGGLTADEEARLWRVVGVAEAALGHESQAAALLDQARARFARDGDPAAADAVARERLRLAAQQGDLEAARTVAAAGRRDTAEEEFTLGVALKRLCRYEEALDVMTVCAARPDLAPTARWPVLRETAMLLRAVGRGEAVDALRRADVLTDAVAQAADRPGAEAELARLLGEEGPSGSTFLERIQDARRMVGERMYEAAERVVREERERAVTDLDVAMWHLTAGRLELETGRKDDALVHLGLSRERARARGLVEVEVQALRLLGRAHFLSRSQESCRRAQEHWDEARRLEDGILGLQLSDAVRRRMSLTVADTYDEWIEAAVYVSEESGDGAWHATASVVAAMETARGNAILRQILPEEPGPAWSLPRAGDHAQAWGWIGAFVAELPCDQAVWLMHAAPGHLHHAVIARGLLFHVTVACSRGALEQAVDAFSECVSFEHGVEKSQRSGQFDMCLQDIAERIGTDRVIDRLPGHVRRLAVVAGDSLSDVPFAAVAVRDGPVGSAEGPGARVPLGIRFALSDLPCLSALAPLRLRAERLRGDTRLLLSPRPEGTGQLARRRRRETVVDGEQPPGKLREALRKQRGRLTVLDAHATPGTLREALAQHRHRLVRIHSHGKHDHATAERSTLQLAPDGAPGAVRAGELERMDLRGCGTLVLGACETGMARRVGRDERTGFVRAAFVAGAASAVAARWVAPAAVAAELLDHFEVHARYLPRDLALQQAQRELYEGVPGTLAHRVPEWRHPANWACWTLYGDSGLQTGAGAVRRRIRSFITRRVHAGQR